MKTNQNRFFLIFLAIEIALSVAFLGKIWLSLVQTPVLPEASAVPRLAVEQLKQAFDQLEKRKETKPLEPIDLGQFKFGKIEPFNP